MTESEGTALCDLLSDSYRSWRHRASGEIVLNGVAVSTQRMRDRVAYARRQVIYIFEFIREMVLKMIYFFVSGPV